MERAVEKGDFGDGPRKIIRDSKPKEKAAHFAAAVDFFQVECNGKVVKVVGKVQPKNEYTRSLMHSDLQFATEVLMYKEIVPFFRLQELFPKLYYGQAEGNPDEDAILLEDLGPGGFRITDEKLFLSYDHLLLAVNAIGKFHAASLTAKEENREEFDRLVSKMKFKPFSNEQDNSIEQCIARGFKPVIDSKRDDVLNEALTAMQDEKFLDLVTKPREPWAVVCHGDFCRNNMLFKYDGNKPVSVKLYDLQTSRYTSPAIDLTFFLYLNTDKATRDAYWDVLLQEYLNTLKKHVSKKVVIDEKGFYEDLASRAVYGYFHCSFFTPMMTLDHPPSIEDYGNQTPEERAEVMVNMGGEKATKLISDIVSHLYEKGYLHKFVQLYKSTK